MHAPQTAMPWHATLDLRFARRAASTILSGRRHVGPLQVQKALYPEGPGICHVAILHPPGGIAAHDRLSITAVLDPQAHALLTTPGASKWYRSNAAQAEERAADAQQRLEFHVGTDAVLEWLPRENILFDGSRAAMTVDIRLAERARYLGWEILCFGRRASGERWRRGTLHLATRVHQGGRVLWSELAEVAAEGGFGDSPVGLAGHSVSATLLAAGFAADPDVLAHCRELGGGPPRAGPAGRTAPAARTGLTWLPGALVARYLGDSSEQAAAWFGALWSVLRPALLGTGARPLRLWAC